MPKFDPQLIKVMRSAVEEAMTRVPSEYATSATKVCLAEYIVEAAAQGLFLQAEDGIRDLQGDWSSDVCSSDLWPPPETSFSCPTRQGTIFRICPARNTCALCPTPITGWSRSVRSPTCSRGSTRSRRITRARGSTGGRTARRERS